MKKTKLLCFLLALVLCLLSVVACDLDDFDDAQGEDQSGTNDGSGNQGDAGKGDGDDRGDNEADIGDIIGGGINDGDAGKGDGDGRGDNEVDVGDIIGGGLNDDDTVDWDGVVFNDVTIKVEVEPASSSGKLGPSSVYLKGPDGNSSDEVLKKVKVRNTKFENDLNIHIEYIAHLGVNTGVGDMLLSRILLGSYVPDVYIGDISSLFNIVFAGCSMNAKNPTDMYGTPLPSYFDFNDESWYSDFMAGLTLDGEKIHILAGDYNLDMIRMQEVLLLNETMFNQNASELGVTDVTQFYKQVRAGAWDYDMLTNMCVSIWQDDGTVRGKADLNDACVGFLANENLYSVFVPATGLSMIYRDADGNTAVMGDIDELNRVGWRLREIYSSVGAGDGVCYEQGLDAVTAFKNGNVLFAQAELGALARSEMKNVTFKKGVVPVPKYDDARQASYHTPVNKEADAAVILITTECFTAVSAYLQYMNMLSGDMLEEYYEFSLKLKYNEDPSIRSMLDLIREGVDGVSFNTHFFEGMAEISTATTNPTLDGLYGALSENYSLSPHYDKWYGAYQKLLSDAVLAFSRVF